MIRIAVVGGIGSGKSYIAKLFGYPVFNADIEVAKLYKKNRKCYKKLKKTLPAYIKSFPVKKNKLSEAVIDNKNNLKKIIKIIHPQIRLSLNNFIKKNKDRKFVILDIPLLLENKINKKNDIMIFVDSKKIDISKRLKSRKNHNQKILNRFKKIQLSLDYKKKKSQFTIKNKFTEKSVKLGIKKILKEII